MVQHYKILAGVEIQVFSADVLTNEILILEYSFFTPVPLKEWEDLLNASSNVIWYLY